MRGTEGKVRRLTRARQWFAGTLGLVSVITVCSISGSAAGADTPLTYGWWSQINQGAIAAPPPPDVPADGMFAENSPGGPLAYSALTFIIPAGSTSATLTLGLTGSPVVTQAPEACLATSSFDQTENGPWSARPSYDCTADVFGATDSNDTTVTFPLISLVRGGELSVVILATGQADRFAMSAPSATALTVTSPASSPPTSGPTPSDLSQGIVQPGPVTPAEIGSTSSPFGIPPSAAPLPSASITVPTSSTAGQAPTLAPTQAAIPSVAGTVTPKARSSWSTEAFSVAGLAMLLIAIVYWADGFGAFPLRSQLLVAKRRSA